MRAAPLKWLLIGLIVVAIAGQPWAQAFAALSAQGCGSTHTAMTDDAHTTMVQAPAKMDMTAVAKTDSRTDISAACAKNCAAMQVFGPVAAAWLPEVWPQVHSGAIELAMTGHTPKPELSPPIA